MASVTELAREPPVSLEGRVARGTIAGAVRGMIKGGIVIPAGSSKYRATR